jgi:hypothetical protein
MVEIDWWCGGSFRGFDFELCLVGLADLTTIACRLECEFDEEDIFLCGIESFDCAPECGVLYRYGLARLFRGLEGRIGTIGLCEPTIRSFGGVGCHCCVVAMLLCAVVDVKRWGDAT